MTARPPSNDWFSQDRPDRVRGVTVVIPVLNEEEAIAVVLERIPRGLADDIIVADGGSNDRTAEIASANGARVLNLGRGYGLACMNSLKPSERSIRTGEPAKGRAASERASGWRSSTGLRSRSR